MVAGAGGRRAVSVQPYLVAEADPKAAAARHSGGHLLVLLVPPGQAMAVGRLPARRRPAALRYAEREAFVLLAASLPQATVTAVYDIDAAARSRAAIASSRPSPPGCGRCQRIRSTPWPPTSWWPHITRWPSRCATCWG